MNATETNSTVSTQQLPTSSDSNKQSQPDMAEITSANILPYSRRSDTRRLRKMTTTAHNHVRYLSE